MKWLCLLALISLVISWIFTVCETLVLPRIWEKCKFPFLAHPTLGKLVPQLFHTWNFATVFAKFKELFSICRYHCKNTLLPLKHGIYYACPKRTCCLLSHLIYANLSLKVLIFVLFIPKFNLKSLVTPFLSWWFTGKWGGVWPRVY